MIAVDAAQTAVALQNGSADASIVNNNFAVDAKLPVKKAIYHDDPASEAAAPYVNIFAARAKDAADPLYQKLVELYHDASVEKRCSWPTVAPRSSARPLLRNCKQT